MSSILGNVAGILYVITKGYIGPSSFTLTVSLTPLLGSVIGSINISLVGPVIGSYILVSIVEGLRVTAFLKIIIYALILMAVVLSRPKGIFHYIDQRYHYFRSVYER
jgi:branched-chain amino acid transport system permease protein